jgi:hypothetical protein
LLRMTTPISRAASLRRYSRRAILRPKPPLDGDIGEGIDDGSIPLKLRSCRRGFQCSRPHSASAGRYRLCENPTTDVMGNQEFFTVIVGAASSAEPAAVGAAR